MKNWRLTNIVMFVTATGTSMKKWDGHVHSIHMKTWRGLYTHSLSGLFWDRNYDNEDDSAPLNCGRWGGGWTDKIMKSQQWQLLKQFIQSCEDRRIVETVRSTSQVIFGEHSNAERVRFQTHLENRHH